MKFPNPFEKKFTLDGLDESAEATKKTPVKSSGFLKKTRLRREAVVALTEKFNIIQKISDPAERLLQCKQLREECLLVIDLAIGKTRLPALGTGAGGVAMMMGGLSTLNPLLFLAGIFTAGTGAGMLASGAKPKKIILSPALSKDCQTIAEIAIKAEAVMEAIIYTEDLTALARAPRALEAAIVFPALKARFQQAAEKNQNLKPLPPAHDHPAGPGF